MSDTIDDYRALKEHRVQERREFLQKRLALFRSEGMPFTTNNNGVHCVFEIGHRTFDVWPSTGKWRARGGVKTYVGIGGFISLYRQLVRDEQHKDRLYVERMEHAFPHLKGETA